MTGSAGLKQVEVGDEIPMDAKLFCLLYNEKYEDLKIGQEFTKYTMTFVIFDIKYNDNNEIETILTRVLNILK